MDRLQGLSMVEMNSSTNIKTLEDLHMQQFHIGDSFFKGRNYNMKNGMPITTLFVMVKSITPLTVWHVENGQVDSDRSTGCQARQPLECVPRELRCVGTSIMLSEKGNEQSDPNRGKQKGQKEAWRKDNKEMHRNVNTVAPTRWDYDRLCSCISIVPNIDAYLLLS